jgi:hypothetical protein
VHKRGPYRTHQLKEIRRLDGNDRRCPNSLREIFNHIRETAENGEPANHLAYLNRLNEAWKGPRFGVETLTDAIFKSTEDGKRTLAFYQMQAYALEAGVPLALILLLSRLWAETRDGDKTLALRTLAAVHEAIAFCDGELRSTGRVDVRGTIDAYTRTAPT